MSNSPIKTNHPEDLSPIVRIPNDPRETNLRWLFLFFACMLTFGTYYGHDSISIFQIPFEKTFGMSTAAFNSLSAVFYLPCTFMPILAGILAEKIGLRKVLLFLSFCVCIGELTLALGIYNESYNLMLAGRAIHGTGHDAMIALNKALVAKWFFRKDLAFAIGMTMAISRFGSSLSSKIGSLIYTSTESLTDPFIFALGIGILSFICCISEISIDAWVEGKIGNVGSTTEIKHEFRCSDLKYLRKTAVLLVISFLLITPPIFCYSNNSAAVLVTRFGFDIERAGDLSLIFFVVATVLTPLVGFLSDKYGGKANIIVFAAALQVLSHALIIFIPDTTEINYILLIPCVSMGISLASYAAAFWPSLTLVTREYIRPAVFGITYSLMNIVLASLMLLVGEIKDSTINKSGGYYWTQVLLAAVSGIGLIVAYLVKKEDLISGMKLHHGAQNDNDPLIPRRGVINLELAH